MDVQLTKDADEFICMIYTEYLQRRKNGTGRDNARLFSFSQLKEILSGWIEDDIYSVSSELKRKAMLKTYTDGSIQVNESAIIYMEDRFGRTISTVLEWVGKLRGIL